MVGVLSFYESKYWKESVHLRYHHHHKHQALSKEQEQELSECHMNNPNTHEMKLSTKNNVASFVNQHVENEIQKLAPSQNTSSNDDEAYLLSMVEATVAKHIVTPPTKPDGKPPNSLKLIMKHA